MSMVSIVIQFMDDIWQVACTADDEFAGVDELFGCGFWEDDRWYGPTGKSHRITILGSLQLDVPPNHFIIQPNQNAIKLICPLYTIITVQKCGKHQMFFFHISLITLF